MTNKYFLSFYFIYNTCFSTTRIPLKFCTNYLEAGSPKYDSYAVNCIYSCNYDLWPLFAARMIAPGIQ